MQITIPELDLIGNLRRGNLTIGFPYMATIDKTILPKTKYITMNCHDWTNLTEEKFEEYKIGDFSIKSLFKLEDVMKLVDEAKRFLHSVSVIEIKDNGDNWYVRFAINLNKRISYVETSVLKSIYKSFNNSLRYDNCYGIPDIDRVVQIAYVELESKIEKEFKFLDSMLSINMEKDGLRVTFGPYNVFMTYNEWSQVDIGKLNKMYSRGFGKFLPMIKNMISTMINHLTYFDYQPTMKELSFDKDGKIEVKETEIQNNIDPILSPSSISGALSDAAKEDTARVGSTDIELDPEIKRIKGRQSFILKLRSYTGLAFEEIEKFVNYCGYDKSKEIYESEGPGKISVVVRKKLDELNGVVEIKENPIPEDRPREVLAYDLAEKAGIPIISADRMVKEDECLIRSIIELEKDEIIQKINENPVMAEIL